MDKNIADQPSTSSSTGVAAEPSQPDARSPLLNITCTVFAEVKVVSFIIRSAKTQTVSKFLSEARNIFKLKLKAIMLSKGERQKVQVDFVGSFVSPSAKMSGSLLTMLNARMLGPTDEDIDWYYNLQVLEIERRASVSLPPTDHAPDAVYAFSLAVYVGNVHY